MKKKTVFYAISVGLLIATPALASGAGEYLNGVQGDDGLFTNFYLPNIYFTPTIPPTTELSDGASGFTFSRFWYSYNGVSYYNSVGFYKYQSGGTINRYPAYEINQPGSSYITYFTANPWTPGNQYSAGMWRSSGSQWHFNWWGPGTYNFGYDATNPAAANDPFEIDQAAYGWNSQNNYTYYLTGALHRSKSNAAWYYLPSMLQFNTGGTPAWGISGTTGGGATMSLHCQAL